MTKDQESFLGMALKVKNFAAKNADSMAVMPVLSGFYVQLEDLITNLIAADMGSRADLRGYAMAKSMKRKVVETLGPKISNALASYGVVNNDKILIKRVSFPSSKWYVCNEDELVTQATIVNNLAAPLASSLAQFGAAEQEVADFTAGITAFIDAISDPMLAIGTRKEDNQNVIEVIDQIRSLFTDKLDILMRSFEFNNPSLYSLYVYARAIDSNGSIAQPTVKKTVTPHSTITVHTASVYSTATFYTIQNQGSEAVYFSLSSITNTEGPEPVLLSPGETRTRLAENLAPAGVFLVVKNDSAGNVKIRVWVE